MRGSILALLLLFVLAGSAAAANAQPRVLAIRFGPDLEVSPVTQDYLTSKLSRAEKSGYDAAASLITLRLRSEPRLAPLESIGVDEPMFVVGAIASTSAASEIQTPADAARAPFGDTYTITSSFALSSAV